MKWTKKRQNRIERGLTKSHAYKRLIYNRVILIALSILLQIGFSAYVLYRLYTLGGQLTYLAVRGIGVVLALLILGETDSPSKWLWIALVLLTPVFGIVLYLFFAEGRATKTLKKKLQKTDLTVPTEENGTFSHPVQEYLFRRGFPTYPTSDTEIRYFSDGRTLFEDIFSSLDKAQERVVIEYFILSGGSLLERFVGKLVTLARRGVKIYLIYDDMGSIFALPPKFDEYLSSLHENIHAIRFNPVAPVFTTRYSTRDHRKILVIDGKTAYTGGANVADEYVGEKIRFGAWKDSGVKVCGKGAQSFEKFFFSVWNAFSPFTALPENNDGYIPSLSVERESVTPFCDSPFFEERVSLSAFLSLIYAAKEKLWIFTPYLILCNELIVAITNAKKRGVDVKIAVPAIPDKKTVYKMTLANFPVLQKAGVEIYKYSSGFLHAKSVYTERGGIVGTVNFDYRSLYLHFEDGVFSTDKAFLAELERDCKETFALSEKTIYKKPNAFRRLGNAVLKMFEPIV